MNLQLAYYGDDFTGSTDVMEALASAGLKTALFLQPPTAEQLAKFPGLRAFGIAGGSRSMAPEQMERELPPAFRALRASGACIVHYKICSTFDSSPTVGSIGRAIEIARRIFGDQPTPLVVGVPKLGRYVVFGNLFARSGLDSEPARLDRHPTMSRHPVTPMSEADLRIHLARQTNLPVALFDVLQLDAPDFEQRFSALVQAGGGPDVPRLGANSLGGTARPVILFDTMIDAHLEKIGGLMAKVPSAGPLFVVGSSGVEYALAAHWRKAQGDTGDAPDAALSRAPAVAQVVAVSGSCSPVTDRQIAQATASGFKQVALDPGELVRGHLSQALLDSARADIRDGRSLILHSSRGTADARFLAKLSAGERDKLGATLGQLLEILFQGGAGQRAAVCGGDTSTAVARALGIEMLEFVSPMAPGSPLCKVHAPGRAANGREICFKGGQVGRDAFFLDLLAGGPT